MNNTDSYVIAWRCWYDSGTPTPAEYNSIQHSLDTIPQDGFQAMRLWYMGGGGRYISGNDYYFFQQHESGELIFGQSNDPYDSIVARYPGAVIKMGKHVPDGMFNTINQLMFNAINPLNDYTIPR